MTGSRAERTASARDSPAAVAAGAHLIAAVSVTVASDLDFSGADGGLGRAATAARIIIGWRTRDGRAAGPAPSMQTIGTNRHAGACGHGSARARASATALERLAFDGGPFLQIEPDVADGVGAGLYRGVDDFADPRDVVHAHLDRVPARNPRGDALVVLVFHVLLQT